MAGSISFPGIGSGIDGASIAKSVFDHLTLQNIPRSNKISLLGQENESINTLNNLLLSLADKLGKMRSADGGAGGRAALSSNGEVATVVADSSANQGSYSLSVSSIASSAAGSFNRTFSSGSEFVIGDAAQSGAVTFTVGEGESAKSFDVQVDELTTAQDVVDQINEKSGNAATASLVNVGTESEQSYKIVFQTSSTGTAEGSVTISADNPELFTASALDGHIVDQATNAKFTISGVGEIERESNTINDVISGLTIELSQIGDTNISVSADAATSSAQLGEFVSAFNSIVEFVNKEDPVSVTTKNGESQNVYGSLSGTNIDEDVVSAIREALFQASGSDGTKLSALGVSTEKSGKLAFDLETFEEAFNKDPTGVIETLTNLADRIAGVNGVVHGFTGYNRSIDSALTANESEIRSLQDTISKVESSATERQEAVLRQFQSLEGLLARLSADADILTRLLQ
ncbi:MAG: flagellar filament capping protein FliD [Deltaproteobacteria bacterium]|nr:flagellar filament capping protein FliD [Deltaproteobacteria bacterium]